LGLSENGQPYERKSVTKDVIMPKGEHRKLSAIARNETKWGYIFIGPCIAGLILFAFGPMIFSIYIALCRWDVATPVVFIGIKNFVDMSRDANVFQALKVTAYYTILNVPLCTVITFLLANLLNTGVKGMGVFRTIFYIPSIVPAVASAALWKNLFAPQYGLINGILRLLGLPLMQFINSRSQVIPSLVVMSAWGAGGGVVIYLAALQGISRNLYEAAEIDGASALSRMIRITIPMMTPIIFYNVLMGLIGSLQTFTAGYIMTQGGPANASLFYALLIYRNAFTYSHMGYASALSWFLFVIIAVLTIVVFRTSDKWVFYENKA
jgi:multiple sugar transport system permease protein